jgi:RecA-family ATPase
MAVSKICGRFARRSHGWTVEGTAAMTDPRRRSEEDEYFHPEVVPESGVPAQQPAHPDRRPLDWTKLATAAPPERDWAVDYWLAQGHVALLAGIGGIGKTLLAQTLGTCLALGIDYIDTIPKPRRVLFWAGEDEPEELWRRQIAICKWLNVSIEELAGKLIVESFMGRDITLAGMAFGQLVPTAAMSELGQQIGDYHADYVFLDSVARVYGGSENDRHQVTQFVSWLANTCAPTGAGLCLLGHPGKAIGSEYSGSTAWEGSVRSRLYLANKLPDQPADTEDDLPTEDTVRYLSRRKANYSAKDWRKLNYDNGVLVPKVRARQPFGRPKREFGQDIVLRAVRKLAELNMHGTSSSASPAYLPKLATQYGYLEELSAKQFAHHMRELIVAKRLQNQKVGQYSNRSPKLGLVEVPK